MYLTFLKFCIGLSLICALVVFSSLEFHFPVDLISYVSNELNRSIFDTKLWLQAVSLIFLWFAGLFGLILFAKTSTKAETTKIRS